MVRCQKRCVAKFLGLFRLLDPLFPRLRFPYESETERFACHLLSSLNLAFIIEDYYQFVFNLLVFIDHIVPSSKKSNWFLCRQSSLDTDGDESLTIVSYTI